MIKFYDTLRALIKEVIAGGFQEAMVERLRRAIEAHIPSADRMIFDTTRNLEKVFRTATGENKIKKIHPGVETYTVDRISPMLRTELDRRILENAQLIKLNREKAINATLQRFAGWASSVPVVDADINQTEVKTDIAKSVKQIKYETRRRQIDQGHKMLSAINEVIAIQTNAIAMRWQSKWRMPGYNYREDHKERDGKVYAIRGSWALQQGLINKGAGYTDDMTAPAQEIYCACAGIYLVGLNQLPADMITEKGRKWLEDFKREMNA